MRAAQFEKYGPPNVLRINTVAPPRPSGDEVMVRVRATSVHPHDTLVRSGKLMLLTGRKFPKGTGLDFAGEIAEVGRQVNGFRPGDKVWGILPARSAPTGAAADLLTVSTDKLSLGPPVLDYIEAAALSGVGAVTIITLRDKLRLRQGERLLVRGASGGVGSVAVQYAKHLGAQVTALANSTHLEFVTGLGADRAFDYATAIPSQLGTFDVVLDLVGTDLARYRRQLNSGGRMAAMAPGSVAALAYVVFSTVYGASRARFFSCAPKRETFVDLAKLVECKALRPVVGAVFSLEDIVAAHQSLELGGGRGKRVVDLG